MKFRSYFLVILFLLMGTACGGAKIPNSLQTVNLEDQRLYDQLSEISPNPADPLALAVSLDGLYLSQIPVPRLGPAEIYQVGDKRTFWVHNNQTLEYITVEAELVAISAHAYFWQDTASEPTLSNGDLATEEDWQSAADSFETSYQAVKEVYGSEDSPGIDGDIRLYILNSENLGKVGGYFSVADQFPHSVNRHSNEGQYFFVSNTYSGGIASDYYNEVLAHEYQHMIHKNLDPNEEGWMNEGLSQVAQQVAGMTGDISVPHYLINLNQSLWHWSGGSSDYAQSFLFLEYLYERFGEDFLANLVRSPVKGLNSIDLVLDEMGENYRADQLFGDFIQAIYINDPNIDEGLFSFTTPKVGNVRVMKSFDSIPAKYNSQLTQYGGAEILQFSGEGIATLSFSGSQAALLVPTNAHSGEYMWWGNRFDGSYNTLTREIDLSETDAAELIYWTWFNIEKDWDYAFVMVSVDRGKTWVPVESTSSVSENPNDSNYGHGLTGTSGDGDLAEWVQERVDLSPFTGQKILLRFSMLTDAVVNEHGIVIDDLGIPEIGWKDDVEDGASGWTAEGFIRIHNRIPQIWSVRAIEESIVNNAKKIIFHTLEIENGEATLEVNFDDFDQLTVFVIAQSRYTTMQAPYILNLTR